MPDPTRFLDKPDIPLSQTPAKQRLAGFFGNTLEHYDSALFILLAPYIASIFFGGQDHLTALIMTYAILPLGLLTKPLGSLVFGWIGDRWGRRQALIYSMFGMAGATVAIGFLPTYQEIFFWSPISLACLRMLQSFFAAGEVVGAALFVLEHTQPSKRSMMSGFYDATSVAGMLIASACVAILGHYGCVESCWRILFWTGYSGLKCQDQKPQTLSL